MLDLLLRRLRRRSPAHTDPLPELLTLYREARHAQVVSACRAILLETPDHVEVLRFLAASLLAQGEVEEGTACLVRVTTLVPDPTDVHYELARIFSTVGDTARAIEHVTRVTQLAPGRTDAWHALGALYTAQSRFDEAERCCRSVLEREPDSADGHRALGEVLFLQGRVEDAIAELRAATRLAPGDAAMHSDLLRMLTYSDRITPEQLFAEHEAWAQRHARPLEASAEKPRNDPDPDRRLRVGYVSPWLRQHAVTFFLEAVIEHHEARDLEIFLYADVAKPDEYSRRLQSHGAMWRKTVDLDDAGLAALVRSDRIEILIDLNGHSRLKRLLAFARRAAPVQVNWLGFPCTTGMSSMDYRITDAYCDPPGMTERFNSERLARLDGSYMAWRPPANAPPPGPLPALANGYVTFGSFSSAYKVTPTTVAMWARILTKVERSRLMLLAFDGNAARRRVIELFATQGIGAGRLEFLPRLGFDEYLASHARADVALDTFPYHGATTTCACLWMGVPVVALAGTIHASRADVSMLSHAGLSRFVARTPDEYVDIAVQAAADLPALAELRGALRPMLASAPNTDGLACARNLERALRGMWRSWCAGERSKP